jgi:hypothetical protein
MIAQLFLFFVPFALTANAVIARSEATKQSILSCRKMGCFASLAMTVVTTSAGTPPKQQRAARSSRAALLLRYVLRVRG